MYTEPNYLHRYDATFSAKNQWVPMQIHTREAWKTSTGTGVRVAVVDSGFDINHPALIGKILDSDDFSGEKKLDDNIGHGTRVSGIIAGKSDASGILGVCPNCQLLLAKIGSDTSDGSVTQGILWATKNKAKVINLSIVTEDYSKLTEEAVNYAWKKGAVLVAAAGNDGSANKVYPAGYEHVIAVGSTDEDEKRAPFSNYGNWVMLAAPGVNVYTTKKNGQYGFVSGTSISAPIVSGVAALVWNSQYGTSNAAVVKRLCETADKVSDGSSDWSCGLVDAENAVKKTTENKKSGGLLQQILSSFNAKK
jgi:thermitase